jgi:hypothetical protein
MKKYSFRKYCNLIGLIEIEADSDVSALEKYKKTKLSDYKWKDNPTKKIEPLMKSLLTIALIPTEKSKEENLFKAVVLQAIEDANYDRTNNPELSYKLEAIEWLTSMNQDFCLIVDLAGYEPVYLRDKIIALRNKGEMQINAAQQKFYLLKGKND